MLWVMIVILMASGGTGSEHRVELLDFLLFSLCLLYRSLSRTHAISSLKIAFWPVHLVGCLQENVRIT